MSEKIYIADKETLDKVYNLLAPGAVYGFIEHCATLAPGSRIEYTGANANFTPVSMNMSTHEMSLNSWADFPVITGCKPYMVKNTGIADYELDASDYTKKAADGSASDVANTSYEGGAFAWLSKIYKQEYMLGDDRVVNFCMTKKDGFEPIGFIDPDDKELEGVWLPMFYGSMLGDTTKVMQSLSGLQPCYSNATAAEKTAIDNFGERAKFLGGPIINVINDLLIMFAKTTNLQAAYGSGNCSGYDASLTPTMGVKQNAVIGGGMFYGSNDGKSLNKIFHSIVLGSYQQWMRDPYTLLVNGRYKVSKNYSYDLTGAAYTDTGIDLAKIYQSDGTTQNNGVFYPHKFKTIPGFGAVPVEPYKGSTSTGGCDGLWQNVDITAVVLRFGACYCGATAGGRALALYNTATAADWNIGAAILLLPPVGVAA